MAIRKLSKTKLAYDAFDILYVIAMSKGDLEQANAYKDSIAETFQAEIRSNSQAKNKYYNSLIQKDRLRAKYQNENRMKNLTIVALSVLFILIVCFILYASRLKRKQLREHNEEEQRRRDLIIEHQKTQMTTMRDFLVRKINILHKLDAIQTADSNHVVLNDEDWDELQAFLNSSDNNFVERLQKAFPDLTKKDIRFLMLIRIRLPFSTIASAPPRCLSVHSPGHPAETTGVCCGNSRQAHIGGYGSEGRPTHSMPIPRHHESAKAGCRSMHESGARQGTDR